MCTSVLRRNYDDDDDDDDDDDVQRERSAARPCDVSTVAG